MKDTKMAKTSTYRNCQAYTQMNFKKKKFNIKSSLKKIFKYQYFFGGALFQQIAHFHEFLKDFYIKSINIFKHVNDNSKN